MKRRSWKALLSEAAAAAVFVSLIGGPVPVLAESSGEETTESSDETDADDDDSEATELSVGTFTNSYAADAAYWDPTFTVTLQTPGGTDIAMSEGQFQFMLQEYTSDSYETASGDALSALNTADGTIADTAVNDADGDVIFEEITFDEEGTYTYIVYEVAGSDAHITYDDTVKLVVITVVEDDAGALSASAAVSVLTA